MGARRSVFDLGSYKIAVVIPAFGVERHIDAVLAAIPSYVSSVIVVDDASPDATAAKVQERALEDDRIILLRHEKNRGVGGATVTGFRKALELSAEIVVKVDGDGQMPLEHMPDLLWPLILGQADVTKGNRFRDFVSLRNMPPARRIGNAGLGFLAKAATGYWNCLDPANGFVASRTEVLRQMPLEALARSFFFEISFLAQLYLLGACVKDVPMPARYGSEASNLSIRKVLLEFPPRLVRTFVRRVVLKYWVYDFSVATLYVIAGVPLLLFGVGFGGLKWLEYAERQVAAPTGTVMLATLPVILGFQLLLSAVTIDLQSVPREPISGPLSGARA
ncbi:MAG: hypothetical protein A2Y93_16065 [Chloroflexi bacterium RBG_13_68_17]|nr:MAG: hypothetical protein A2Y93_16065 [Chloroflexi bacterium RBG_13_68_17]